MSISDRNSSPLPTSTIEKLKRFSDRHSLTRDFVKHIHANLTPEKILFFQGAGGNGKSFLLDFLQIHCCKQLPDEVLLRLQQEEKFSKAIIECVDSLNLAPNHVYAHNNHGNALVRLGNLQSRLSQSEEALESYQRAIASFQTALDLAPNDVYALNNLSMTSIDLANLYVNLSEPETARECFKNALAALSRSLEIAPNDAFIRSLRDNLAVWLQGKGSE